MKRICRREASSKRSSTDGFLGLTGKPAALIEVLRDGCDMLLACG